MITNVPSQQGVHFCGRKMKKTCIVFSSFMKCGENIQYGEESITFSQTFAPFKLCDFIVFQPSQ